MELDPIEPDKRELERILNRLLFGIKESHQLDTVMSAEYIARVNVHPKRSRNIALKGIIHLEETIHVCSSHSDLIGLFGCVALGLF